MGLCASQARLLMLTARKSDLQFRMMQITNAKQMLAMQEEEIALKYSDALNNRQYTTMIDGKDTAIDGSNIYSALATAGCTDYYINEAGLAKKFGLDPTKTTAIDVDDGNGGTTQKNVIDLSSLNSAQIYEAFEAGLITLTDEEGNVISAASYAGLKDEYYTDDDGAAEAEYTRDMAKIKRKETQLDLEAEQIETQHSAVSTEIESVQNLVKKESENSFKYFS